MSDDQAQTKPDMPQDPAPSSKLLNTSTSDLQVEAEQAMRAAQGVARARPESDALFDDSRLLVVEVQTNTQSTPITVQPKGDVVLGRRDPSTQEAPDVDLSPFAAYQLGVSRKHAIIRLHGTRLVLIDLGSRNGTFLNGQRMPPNVPQTLYSGDELRLGKIVMKLTFRPKEG